MRERERERERDRDSERKREREREREIERVITSELEREKLSDRVIYGVRYSKNVQMLKIKFLLNALAKSF